MEFDLPKERSSIIKVIGIGGGGCNAVNHMFEQGIKDVNFVICNTDAQALEASPIPNKIQLGPDLTQGRGAGSHPERGKEATMESLSAVKDILESHTEMVFITAGMGGGTGTGGAPVVAKIAREMGVLTVGIVTVPFSFEGKRRIEQAHAGIAELKAHVDALLVVSNDKLREVFGNLKLSEAFSKADNVLTTAAKGIAEIITVTGYVNVDFEDVKTVLRDSGVAIMGSGVASGDNRAIKAVEAAMSSPLLSDSDIQGARHILLNITSGDEEVLMDEITEITEYVQDCAGNSSDIIWGNCQDANLNNEIMVTVIATGFEGGSSNATAEEKKVVYDLEKAEVEAPVPPAPPVVEQEEPVLVSSTTVATPVEAPADPMEPVLKTAPAQEEKEEPQVDKNQIDLFEGKPIQQVSSPQLEAAPTEEVTSQVNQPVTDEEVFLETSGLSTADELQPEQVQALRNARDEQIRSTTPVDDNHDFNESFISWAFDEEEEAIAETPAVEEPVVETTPPVKEEPVLQPTFEVTGQPESETYETPQYEAPQETAKEEEPVLFNYKSEPAKPEPVKPEPVSPLLPREPEADTIPLAGTAGPIARPKTEADRAAEFVDDFEEREKARLNEERKKRLRNLSMKFNNVEELEKTPAYLRRNVELEDEQHSSEQDVSRYTLGEGSDDSEDTGLRKNNSFLHDNVD